MTVDNTHQPYSAADIARYIEGSMTKHEMHALEMAAMDDPFLADAIEGYREAYEKREKGKLLPYLETAKAYPSKAAEKKAVTAVVVPLWRRKAFQYAVAAAVVVGSGWYIFNLSQVRVVLPPEVSTQTTPSVVATDSAVLQPQNQAAITQDSGVPPNDIVVNKKKDIVTLKTTDENTSSHAFSNTESLQKNEGIRVDDEGKYLSAAPVPGESKPTVREDVTAAKSIAAEEKIISTDSAVASGYFSQTKKPLNKDLAASKMLSGKVVDKEKYPLDNITIQAKGTADAVASDEMGRFEIKVPDTTSTLIVSGNGYKTKEFKANSSSTSKVELQLDAVENDMQEVVVSAYAKSKRKAAKEASIVLDMDTADAAPVGGWDNFTKYIDENKQVKKQQAKVRVVLSLEVDSSGHHANIDIIESAGKEYDKEAIRLLKAGPLWKNKTKDETAMAKITIVL